MAKNKSLIRIGAYALLVIGILITISLLILGIVLFVSFPDALLSKKVIIGGAFIAVAFLILLLSISVFESMQELLVVDQEVLELEEEIKQKL